MCISLLTLYWIINTNLRIRNGPSCMKMPVMMPNISPCSNISRREICLTSARAIVIGLTFFSRTPLKPLPRPRSFSVCRRLSFTRWMYFSLVASPGFWPYLCRLTFLATTSSGETWTEQTIGHLLRTNRRAVTSILSQRLLHKMTNSRSSLIARLHVR